jgi:hypothetical protein
MTDHAGRWWTGAGRRRSSFTHHFGAQPGGFTWTPMVTRIAEHPAERADGGRECIHLNCYLQYSGSGVRIPDGAHRNARSPKLVNGHFCSVARVVNPSRPSPPRSARIQSSGREKPSATRPATTPLRAAQPSTSRNSRLHSAGPSTIRGSRRPETVRCATVPE